MKKQKVKNGVVIYQAKNGAIELKGDFSHETVWATVAKNATVQIEGGRSVERIIEYYNLDAIISVGCRVNSKMATQFRQ